MAKLRITYSKSAIGYSKDQKATIRSLGLHKLNHTVIQKDTPAIRGMIFKVRHLVRIEEVGDDAVAIKRPATRRPIVRPAAPDAKPAAKPAATVVLTADDDQVADAAPAAVEELEADDELVAADKLDAAGDQDEAEEVAAIDGQADDDLEVIEGIGPKIAGALREAGITTFAQLAAADVAQLTEILQAANIRLAVSETWPEQAALAAAGDWDKLKELQDQLKGGRRE